MDPLKTINIPNTETMRSFSLHFQSSVAPYEQHLSALEENQEPVAASWQGDASVAYEKTNQQLVSIGRMHIEQMQQASHIFDYTANRFNEGKGLQETAEWQWGMGMAAETALEFPVASSWYVLAQKTQEGALAAIESGRVYFNSGFAALQEQITSALSLKQDELDWSMPPAYSVDPVSLSQTAVSKGEPITPASKHPALLPTPPPTPPQASPTTSLSTVQGQGNMYTVGSIPNASLSPLLTKGVGAVPTPSSSILPAPAPVEAKIYQRPGPVPLSSDSVLEDQRLAPEFIQARYPSLGTTEQGNATIQTHIGICSSASAGEIEGLSRLALHLYTK